MTSGRGRNDYYDALTTAAAVAAKAAAGRGGHCSINIMDPHIRKEVSLDSKGRTIRTLFYQEYFKDLIRINLSRLNFFFK